MVVYNYTGKEINAKVVYYGPALSGKTTNLEWIYSKIPVEYSGKMVSLRTQADRTIFFDFLPLDLGVVDGFRTRFMLYTVPGQVHYNATRKMVLKGVDGVVFVADSEPSRMHDNLESLRNLRDNLEELGIDPDSIPICLQWNKRDLPNSLDVTELENALNPEKHASFESCALTGEGVYETLHALCQLIYRKLSGDVQTGVEDAASGESSLFGDTIAQCLQEVDERPSEPIPMHLDADEEPLSTTEADDASVLAAILGGRTESASRATEASVEEEQTAPEDPEEENASGELVGVTAASQAEGRAEATHQSPSSVRAEPPTSAPLGEALDGALGQEHRGSAGGAQGSSGGEPSTEIEHPSDVIAEMQAQRPSQASRPSDSSAGAEGAGGAAGDSDGDIDLDVVLGERGTQEDLELIQDPRRLPGETSRAVSGSISQSLGTPLSQTGSGSAGAFREPASRARVLEVPVTVDSSVFEEGRSLRIVLNVSVKDHA